MIKIYQILPYFLENDSASECANTLHRSFTTLNLKSEICETTPKITRNDYLIYHSSGSQFLDSLVPRNSSTTKKVLLRHSTPSVDYFAPYSEKVYRKRNQELQILNSTYRFFDSVIVNSITNAHEFSQRRFSKIFQTPFFTFPRDFSKIETDRHFQDLLSGPAPLFLTISKVSPDQKMEDTLRIFSWYCKNFQSKSRLLILGTPQPSDYLMILKEITQDLMIQHQVFFFENLDRSKIKACYEAADLFLSMAEPREIPREFLEANHFGVPLFSSSRDGYFKAIEGLDPFFEQVDIPVLAAQVDLLLSDPLFRKKVTAQQLNQFQTLQNQYSLDSLLQQVLKALNLILPKLDST